MKIVGSAFLEYIYPDGRKEPVGPPVCNDICLPAFKRMFTLIGDFTIPTKRDATSQNHSSSARWKLFYRSADIKPTRLNAWCGSDGNVNVNQDFPTYTPGATANDPDVVTFNFLIPAPVGSARTIRVLGLYTTKDNWASHTVNSESDSKLTILRLTTPCTQNTNVQLSVTYRLFLHPVVDSSNQRTSPRVYEDLRGLFTKVCNAVNSVYFDYRGLRGSLTSSAYQLDDISPMTLHGGRISGGTEVSNVLTDSSVSLWSPNSSDGVIGLGNAFQHSLALPAAHVNTMGLFMKHLWMGDAGYELSASSPSTMSKGYVYQPVLPDVLDPRQNTYAQRNTPAGPLQDTSNLATMSGSLTLNVDNWTDPHYQKLFRVRVTTTGNLSTPAKYKVEVFDFIAGFAGNLWIPRTAFLPQTRAGGNTFRGIAQDQAYEVNTKWGGVTYRSPDATRYVAAFECNRTKNGIAIYDVLRGSKLLFNANTSPALPVTAVSDGDCTKGYTYIGCADTGLWRINPALDTVEQIPAPAGVTNKVYQICAKNDTAGTLWVLYDGGLCKLSNPDAAVGALSWSVHNPTTGSPTFTYAGITDSKWSNVSAMIIDPDNVGDDQFLFVSSVLAGGVTSGGFRLGYVWWSTGLGAAVNPTTNGVNYTSFTWTLANLLRISDSIRCVDGWWVAGVSNPLGFDRTMLRFQYGANNMQASSLWGPETASAQCRAVPATIGGNKGFLSSHVAGSDGNFPSVFTKTSGIASFTNGTYMSNGNANCEFAVRTGITSATPELSAYSSDTTGLLGRPLIYLPGSNMFFSYECDQADAYGVTPFMLPPTHAKYSTYESAFWKKYGWDGSAWVRNHAGARDVHASLETAPDMNGLRISFSNGVSGTSFVANEYWIGTLGLGLMKDNGTTYNCNFAYTTDATAPLTQTDTVPTTPLGTRVDEPVTFSPASPDEDGNDGANNGVMFRCLQNKGLLIHHAQTSNSSGHLVADQLIPANSDFDLRFKWISFEGNSQEKALGVATGTTTYNYSTGTLRFQYNATTGNLEVYNNSTLVGSVITTPSIDAVCRIARVGTTLSAYYNGTLVGTVSSSTSAFSILARGTSGDNETGWYDMMLSYTEARRVLIVGDDPSNTGYYSPKFSGLTSSGIIGDTKVLIGSGSPLQAILDYTPAGNPLSGTGRVKVASGAGWLIFHDSEAANPVTVKTVAHYFDDNF